MFGLKKGMWFLIAFNLAYLLIFAIYYISIKNLEFLWYIFIVGVLISIIAITLKSSKLDYVALWGLSIWGLLHMLCGGLKVGSEVLYKFKIYEFINRGGDFYILKMDQVVHFYGFAVAAIVVYQLIRTRMKPGASRGLAVFLAWIGGMGFGALNEVIEFIAFITLSKTGVGDVYNTGFDLVFNLLGALAGAFFANYLSKR
jgi:putative membrane protein